MEVTMGNNGIFTIKAGKMGNRVLITAGVHGDEYEPMLAARQLIAELPDILLNGSVTVVPVTNESAYRNSSRFGADGLDLARICPGKVDGSVSEQAAARISSYIAEADYLIDMHTGGLAYDIYPMVGYMLHPDEKVLQKQQQLAAVSGFPLIWGTDGRPDGRTLSIARDRNIPAVYFEYGGGTGIRKQIITRYKQSVFQILAALGMCAAVNEGMPAWEYWLEDGRADSGHFQSKTPAPAAGIFVADVVVGDEVETGECLGKIMDPLSGATLEVRAGESGLVHFLKTLVHVEEGDALGGILPVMKFKKTIINGE